MTEMDSLNCSHELSPSVGQDGFFHMRSFGDYHINMIVLSKTNCSKVNYFRRVF